jgi:hypothetical protein
LLESKQTAKFFLFIMLVFVKEGAQQPQERTPPRHAGAHGGECPMEVLVGSISKELVSSLTRVSYKWVAIQPHSVRTRITVIARPEPMGVTF